MTKCPKCKEKIKSLRYEMIKKVIGNLIIFNDCEEFNDDEYIFDENTINFYCPDCDELLFENGDDAINFLKQK